MFVYQGPFPESSKPFVEIWMGKKVESGRKIGYEEEEKLMEKEELQLFAKSRELCQLCWIGSFDDSWNGLQPYQPVCVPVSRQRMTPTTEWHAARCRVTWWHQQLSDMRTGVASQNDTNNLAICVPVSCHRTTPTTERYAYRCRVTEWHQQLSAMRTGVVSQNFTNNWAICAPVSCHRMTPIT